MDKKYKQRLELLQSLGLEPAADDGFFGEMADRASGAFVSGMRGLGATANEIGLGNGMQDYFDSVQRVNRQWDRPLNESTSGYIGGAIGNVGGSTATLLPGIAGGAAIGTAINPGGGTIGGAIGGGIAAFAQSFGDNVQRNRTLYGERYSNGELMALAAGESTIDAFIESALGTVPLMGRTLGSLGRGTRKQLAMELLNDTARRMGRKQARNFWLRVGESALKNGAEEGLEEGLQYANEWMWRKFGGDETAQFKPGDMLDASAQGAIGGFALGLPFGASEQRSRIPVLNSMDVRAEELPVQGMPEVIPQSATPLAAPPPGSSAAVKLTEAVAGELGLKVRYFDEEGAPAAQDGGGNAVNGWYDEKNNEFWIDRTGQNVSPLETLGHEFKHFLNRKHGDLVKTFDDLLKSGMNDAGKQALAETEADYRQGGYAAGQGNVEFSADTFGKMWTDPEFWRDVTERAEKLNAGMGQRMLDALQEFIKVVRAKLKNIGTPDAKILFDNMGELRNEAARIMAEVKRQNGTSTEAENVVGVKGSDIVQSIPVSELNLDPARFQFKSKANKVTGVDERNQLGGEWDPKTAGNFYVWEEKDGKKFVVNGHHRFQLAQDSHVPAVNGIVDREADGVTAEQARRNGVLINIRDEQGDVKDYADFVRHEDMDEKTAEKEGVLAREKGRTGYTIGKYASDNLYGLFRSDDISEAKTATIADVARKDEGLEAAGIRAAKTMPNTQLREFLKCLANTPRETAEQGDLFGFDDSAIQLAEKLSKLAAKHIREVKEKVNAAKSAIKKPDAARKLGVEVGSSAQKLFDKALLEQQAWEQWYTNPELSAQLRKEAGIMDSSEKPNNSTTHESLQVEKNNNVVSSNEQTDSGRFNQNSDTPLLTPEEDASDFQLYDETPAEARARDAKAERDAETAKEQAQREAAKNSPDLDFGNMFQNEMKEADEQIQRNRQVVSTNPSENAAADEKTQQGKDDVKTLLREVINMQTDGNIKQHRLLRIAKSLGVSEKEIQERCEAEVVAMAREINVENISDDAKYQKMLDLYDRQPNFTKRTSTSVANQAYSTPVPLAWLIGKRIGLTGHLVYEPTAGTGMLTVAGNPSTISVNEIDTLRNSILSEQGFLRVTGKDATTTRPNHKYSRVIMNPPFGGGVKTTFDGYNLTKLDHIIAARALETMYPDGSAAIIIGANTEQRDGMGRTAFPDHVFMSYLYDKFNVKDNFIVSGDLYRKQGAGYPVRVLTLSGLRIGGEAVTPPKTIEIIKSWNILYQKLKGELDHGVSETERSIDAHPATGAGEQKQSSQNAGRRSSRDVDALGTDRRVSEDRTGTADGVGKLHEQQSGRSGGVGADQSQGRIVSGPSEPVNRDGGRVGNSSENIHGRTETRETQSGNVADGGQSGSERPGTPVRSRGHSTRPAVSASGLQVGEQRGELNNGYIPASKSADKMDVVVPRFMAEAVEHSLHRVGKTVGDIDKFVQSELGYETPDELYKSLSDVQIDGVAQAITTIRNGDGFVLGDQTGIGKGRQCAAVIRWAQNHGIMPIFLTRDQNLFTDMYRDGKDIGSIFNPLIVASDAEKANINDQSGKKLVGLPPNQSLAFSEMIADKSKYDCVFIPYSQLSKNGRQRAFLRSLIDSRKCLLVMDEAHEASGDSARGHFFYGNDGILHKDVGVLYASATFAKRPDNMALYFRTNIRKAVDNIDSLKKILVKGGVPLQQLLSSGLALDGQYTRRERDFTGVKFDTIIADPVDSANAMIDVDGTKAPEMSSRERLIERYDRVAYVLGRLMRHSELIKEVIKKAEKDNYGSANTREGKSIQMASFASVTHNYISQLLLASKCDIVIAQAEKSFRNGQKPVIALTNTMESVLSDFVTDNDIENGDPLSMKFSDILESAMLRMYKFTKKTGKGDLKQIQFNPDDYGLGEAHGRMLQEIHELDDIDLPISPIDYIKFQLEQRGIRTGEITGRELIVNYGTAVPTLATRSAKEMNKNRNVNNFNSGNIDAIVLNASGSTGLSLHSSFKFADQKQRNMIMAQPSLDIAVVQQMFGRVLRSGQVNSPTYEILSSPLAAERRPMMVLSRKLQSLNANTTANNKGAVSLGLDFMNKYGDLVAQQYLDENPEVASQVDLNANSGEDSSSAPEDLMTKLTGRMAILPDSQQQEILDDLITRYTNMVEFLKKTGNYDLEITVHDDWDAITNDESEIVDGNPNGSIFQQPVILKKLDIKEQRNIRAADEVLSEIHENLGVDISELSSRLDKDFLRSGKAIDNLEKAYAGSDKGIEFINDRKILLREVMENFKNFMLRNNQEMIELAIGEENYSGIITGYHVTGKFNPRSPVVASKIMIDFAVTDTIGKISIPYSRFRSQEITYSHSFVTMKNSFTGEKKSIRTPRYAITGNLLRGLEYAEAGKVVSYKTHEGKVESALLMPKTWIPEKLMRDPRNEIHTVTEAMEQLAGNRGIISSGDGLNIVSRYGDYWIEVPRAKNKGGKYYLDQNLLDIVGGDFQSYGRMMRTDRMTDEQVRKAIVYLIDKKEDTYLKKDTRDFSLKRHRQVNPVRESGDVQSQHQDRIDNMPYETRLNATVNENAQRRLTGMGGFPGAIQAMLDGDFTIGSDVSQRVMQLVLNSDEFKKLNADARSKISDLYINSAGTEVARSLAARRLGVLDLDDIKSIQAHVNAFMAKIDKNKPHHNLRKQIMDEFGFDIDNLPDDVVNNPDLLDAIIRRMSAARATKFDKAYEFWINSILSAPTTHFANTLGNTFNAAYELGVKRFAEATINSFARRKDGARFGEFKELTHAINWRDALSRARIAYNVETLTTSGKLDHARNAIGGKTGRVIRSPGRLLRAADEFAKAIVQPIEAAAYAYREGKNNHLSGADLRDYIKTQVLEADSTANDFGRQRGLELTFQEDPGKAVTQLLRWREAGGVFGTLLKFTLPFIKTPHNILMQGIRKSPLGAVSLAWEAGKIMTGKRAFDGAYVSRTAEQLIAWGIVAMLAGVDDDDDDDMPFLTGTSASYGSTEQKFKANKIPPYSIRIGGNYYSYKRIEPLSTGLAFIADGLAAYHDAKNGEDGTRIMKRLMGGVKQLVVEKSFLDSLGEINRIVSDPERDPLRYLTNFASSWMPNVVRQTVNLYDDNVRDNKSRARGIEFWEDQFQITTNRMGVTRGAPKLDYFGREITKDSLADSGPLWPLMRLVPIQSVKPDENMNRAERLIMNYNQSNQDAEYYPDVPAYYFQRDGKKLYFSGDDYQDFSHESGGIALKQINNAFRHGLLHEDKPTDADIQLIKKIFTRARKEVRDKMYRKGRYSE